MIKTLIKSINLYLMCINVALVNLTLIIIYRHIQRKPGTVLNNSFWFGAWDEEPPNLFANFVRGEK